MSGSRAAPLDVFFTIDVEIWCDGWADLDRKFPAAFRRYVQGPTADGDVGLDYQCGVLADHGLPGTFFVEPLFSLRFGPQPLQEIVGRILGHDEHRIELHLHPEWVDEAVTPVLDAPRIKRQHLRQYTRDEQRTLVGCGLALLAASGATAPVAFRAGSFALNADTLPALESHGLRYDLSYNESYFGPESGLRRDAPLLDAIRVGGIWEVPMTVFVDGRRRLRHAQLGACSASELESLLWQALRGDQRAFVLLSHNFELLTPDKQARDRIVDARFQRLCRFLGRHRGDFNVRTLRGYVPAAGGSAAPRLRSSVWQTGRRMLEQWQRTSLEARP